MKKLWFLVIVLSFMVMVPYVAHADGVTPTVVTLIAGGGGKEKGAIDVGYVTVTNDADNLYVTYTTTDPWCMTATSLQVATSVDGIPQTKKGNPEPGQFQYQTTADPCVSTVQYPIQNTWAVGDTLDIAAYAQVINDSTYEGAWGAGTAFSGKNWDTYFSYTIQNPVVSKIIFVTSLSYTGNLGGLAGADAKCQYLADNAGLPGTYKAWLSDDTTSAAERLTHNDGPYILPNDVTVFDNWTDISGFPLQQPIDVDESGGSVPLSSWVWTDTMPNGTETSAYNCENWQSSDETQTGAGGEIIQDNEIPNNILWTAYFLYSCDTEFHLYCVQQ